ncbi:hypothetical protein V6N13_001959 [Hibiscus sabdariffa]
MRCQLDCFGNGLSQIDASTIYSSDPHLYAMTTFCHMLMPRQRKREILKITYCLGSTLPRRLMTVVVPGFLLKDAEK